MAKSPVPNSSVLYVEDEESDALFMQMAFEKAGLGRALHTVGDGRAAIEYLSGVGLYGQRQQFPLPTVLLLDLNLPVLSGFEVLKWVRAQSQFEALPVVVFSSSARQEDKARAQALGANQYVEKPSSALLFGAVVQQLRDKWLD